MMQQLMKMLGVSQEVVEPEDTYTCVDTAVCGGYGRLKICTSTGSCRITQNCC